MILTEDKTHDVYQIQAYGKNFVTINQKTYHSSLIISPSQLWENWGPKNLSALKATDFAEVIHFKPELVLLGTGPTFLVPQKKQLESLENHHIALEYMDTGAACRTYMALASEGRNVVAALLLE